MFMFMFKEGKVVSVRETCDHRFEQNFYIYAVVYPIELSLSELY